MHSELKAVMPGLVPGIHVFSDSFQARRGWYTNSGLPEFVSVYIHKSGKPDL